MSLYFLLKKEKGNIIIYILYIFIFWRIYLSICQTWSGGDDEDCSKEDKIPGKPGIQQQDEKERRLVDGIVFHVNQERIVIIIMKTMYFQKETLKDRSGSR